MKRLCGVLTCVVFAGLVLMPASDAGVLIDETFYRRGDVNGDGGINLSDPIALQNYLFMGSYTPPCVEVCDANYDGSVNMTDSIYLLNYLFSGGPSPDGSILCY